MRYLGWLTIAIASSCSRTPPLREQPTVATAHVPAPNPEAKAAPEPAEPSTEPIVIVSERAALADLDQGPLSFGALIGGASAPATLAELSAKPAWQSIQRALAAELSAVAAADPLAGPSVARHSHRLLDARWLTSDKARFELIAVVNRFDRLPFTSGHCGEVRLVYRLGYRTTVAGQSVNSRLPLTAIAEFAAEPPSGGSCREAAARWLAPKGLSGAALGKWLGSDGGPLAALRGAALLRLNLNLQTVRWPSTIRPDLGGHAEYALETFVRAGDGYRQKPLENTPDVARLRSQPKLRARLLDWLKQPENLARIDEGSAQLPDEFLATKSISVSPHGLTRSTNQLFRQLFSPAEFTGTKLSGYRTISSPKALVRRLDDLSCPGCHQSRSLAGFHLLGEDAGDTAAGNALGAFRSPHLERELERRRDLLARAAEGKPDLDFHRPFAERAPGKGGGGGYGAHCGLGDEGFASWTCDAGLRCQVHGEVLGDPEPAIGVCLPEERKVGDPCERALISQSANPHRDRLANAKTYECGPSAPTCNRSAVGFPGGMCTASCESLPGDASCGAIAILTSFNQCLAQNKPFSSCIAENSSPAGLRRCSSSEPCRDDYLCAMTPQGEGACIPPYFLFQMRVDGHPAP